MMLRNYPVIFLGCTATYWTLSIYKNQFLANFEMSQSLPFLMNMSIWLFSDWTIWYNLTSLTIPSNICSVFYFYTITFTGGCQVIHKNHWEVKCCTVTLRGHQQKAFVTIGRFWLLRARVGGWVNPLALIFFTDNIEWSSKNLWKNDISTDVKANKNKK